ncbi:MAG: LysR family transcriptional regulator [Clostridium sp.]|nr:LysR family transcriptional regulator [Clostridium sp.]
MTLLTYQIVQAVAEQGSFRLAAQILNLTPSAISHAISTAEKELGYPLFYRSKNGATLTEYGTKLRPYIAAVLNCDIRLQEAIGSFNGQCQGTVRIGTISSFCQGFIPSIVTDFSKANPDIELTVYQGTSDEVCDWISTGKIDFGFLPLTGYEHIPLTPVYEDEVFCVTPKQFRFRHRSYIEYKELTDCRFISHSKNTDILQLFDENRIAVQSCCQADDDSSAIAMAAAGLGLYMISGLALPGLQIPDNINVYPFRPALRRTIGMYSPEPEAMPPAVKSMYKHIKHTFSDAH